MLSGVQLTIYAIVLVIMVCGIASIMEIYKKAIRKGKAKPWENYLMAFVLTCLSGLFMWASGIFHPLLHLIGGKVWMDYILYGVVVYFLQFQLDRKIIKKVIKAFVSNFLKKTGLSEEQIKEIMDNKK